MKKINLSYPIYIGQNILKDLQQLFPLHTYSKIVVISDQNVIAALGQKFRSNLNFKHEHIIVPPGEKEKNIHTVIMIWQKLLEAGCDRKSLVINIGGGVISDMGGFAASTYMRGIDFINIPTTLLSQVDASVGGKTGIDFSEIKNLIGTFQQPKAVIIDIETLKTLPDRQFIEGFGEIIKHGLIRDKKYYQFVTSKKPKEFTDKELISIIESSCEIKSDIVRNDEKENGARKLLNFGHTLGHAVETESLQTENPLFHGEAIALGMIAEAKISQLKNFITNKTVTEIIQNIKNAGLPVKIKINTENVLKIIESDKKKSFGKIKWTLLKETGKAVIDQEVNETVIKEALEIIIK